jgi:hypothetical protein
MTELLQRLQAFGVQLLAVLVDSVFVGLWLVVHTLFEKHVASQFRLNGVHAYTFAAFQGIFALATFFPVAAYVLVDLYRVYKRTRQALSAREESI